MTTQHTLPAGVGELHTGYSSYDAYRDCLEDRKINPEEYEGISEKTFLEGIVADQDACNYEDMLICLEELMEEVNPDRNNWHCEVRNFGWRRLNGFTDFSPLPARDLLRRVLPDTDCSFKIYEYTDPESQVKGIAINNAHHDAPTWEEWYFIVPQKEEEEEEEYYG